MTDILDKVCAITAFVEEGFTFIRLADSIAWKIKIGKKHYGDYATLDKKKMDAMSHEEKEVYILEMFDSLKDQARASVKLIKQDL